jgi:hypothetical protein
LLRINTSIARSKVAMDGDAIFGGFP